MVCVYVSQQVFVCRSVICMSFRIDLSHGPFGHSSGLIRFGAYHSFVPTDILYHPFGSSFCFVFSHHH